MEHSIENMHEAHLVHLCFTIMFTSGNLGETAEAISKSAIHGGNRLKDGECRSLASRFGSMFEYAEYNLTMFRQKSWAR